MAGIAEVVRRRFALQSALIPQGKVGLAIGPEVQLSPDPLVPVIKRQMRRPLGPQAQSGAPQALGVPQVQPDFIAVSSQGGPDVAFGVAHHQGFSCQAGGVRPQQHIGLGGDDGSQHDQDKAPMRISDADADGLISPGGPIPPNWRPSHAGAIAETGGDSARGRLRPRQAQRAGRKGDSGRRFLWLPARFQPRERGRQPLP